MNNSKAREHYLELVERRSRMWQLIRDERGNEQIVPVEFRVSRRRIPPWTGADTIPKWVGPDKAV